MPDTGHRKNSLCRKFVTNVHGTAAIEYAFIVMLIALVIIGVLTAMGTDLADIFNSFLEQKAAAENG